MPSASARSNPLPVILTVLILLAVGGAAGWRWLQNRPEPAPPLPQASTSTERPRPQAPPPTAPPAVDGQEDASLEVLVRRQEAYIEQQAERIRNLEAQVAHWQGEAERYQQGLGRAVDELNRQAATPRPRSRPAATPYQHQPEPYLASVLGPRVHIDRTDVVVTGRIHNAGDAPGEARLGVELLLDGRSVDQQWLDLRVGVRSTQSYTATFRGRAGPTGTWSARVDIQ